MFFVKIYFCDKKLIFAIVCRKIESLLKIDEKQEKDSVQDHLLVYLSFIDDEDDVILVHDVAFVSSGPTPSTLRSILYIVPLFRL